MTAAIHIQNLSSSQTRPKISTAWEFFIYKPNTPGLTCEWNLEVIISLYVLILLGLEFFHCLPLPSPALPTVPVPGSDFLSCIQPESIHRHSWQHSVCAYTCVDTVNFSLMSTNNNFCEKASLMLMLIVP